MATSQRKFHCGNCKEKGHSARTCPKLGGGGHKVAPKEGKG